MAYSLWKAPNERHSSDERRAVSIEPDDTGVIGYVCCGGFLVWMIEGDAKNRTFRNENEAASALVQDFTSNHTTFKSSSNGL